MASSLQGCEDSMQSFSASKTSPTTACSYFFFFGSTGGWTQGLTLARQALYHFSILTITVYHYNYHDNTIISSVLSFGLFLKVANAFKST
jgi:hypothetical protein